MNCLGCGAAMQIAGNRNHFHCPHCGRFEFPQETGDGVVPLNEKTDWTCPVCQVALETALIEGEDVRYCRHCRGFLCAADAFGRIVAKRRALHGPHEQIADPFDTEELKRALRCPGCERRMETHPYFGGGNAVVDTCESCRCIWLDAGELAIIERYIPREPRLDPVLPLSEDPHPPSAVPPPLTLEDLFF
jgi:Zn-finger nucleic acid-binding protein